MHRAVCPKRYRVAYHLPQGEDREAIAEVRDFPAVVSQGFDLADARVMIASALEEMVRLYLEEGKALPLPDPGASAAEADLIELLPLRVEAGVGKLRSDISNSNIFSAPAAGRNAKVAGTRFA